MEGLPIRKAFGAPETLELLISFGVGVSSGLVANWLFAKLEGRSETTLRIEEQEVTLKEDQIKRVITRAADHCPRHAQVGTAP